MSLTQLLSLESLVLNRQTKFETPPVANVNWPDVLAEGVKLGFSRQNLIELVNSLVLIEAPDILKRILPLSKGTAADLTRQYQEYIMDPVIPTKIAERGRPRLVTTRTIRRVMTLVRSGLQFDETLAAGDQSMQTPEDQSEHRIRIIAHIVAQMNALFVMQAISVLMEMGLDDTRGPSGKAVQQNKTIAELFEDRNRYFGLFDKAASANQTPLIQLQEYIRKKQLMVAAENLDSIILQDNLGKLIANSNSALDYNRTGTNTDVFTKSTNDLVNKNLFQSAGTATTNLSVNGYVVVPVVDTHSMITYFGRSIMIGSFVFGEFYPLGDCSQWTNPHWNKNFETIYIADSDKKKDTAISLMRAIEECGEWDKSGNPIQKDPKVLYDMPPDNTGKTIDLFQDKQGDVYKLFGQWPETHFNLSNFSAWVTQVVKTLREKYQAEITAAQTEYLTKGTVTDALKDLLTSMFPKAVTFGNGTVFEKDVTEERFLVRVVDGKDMTATEQPVFESISLYSSAVNVNVGNDDEYVTMVRRISSIIDLDLEKLTQLIAYQKFLQNAKIDYNDTGNKLVTYKADRPDLQPAVERLSKKYFDIFRAAKTQIDPRVIGKNDADAKTNVLADFPKAKFGTAAYALKNYSQLVTKYNNWDTTNYIPMSLSDPTLPMTKDELKKFIEKHGAIFEHERGKNLIQGKIPALNHQMIAQHFSLMKHDESYKRAFIGMSESMDSQLRNFFSDSELIHKASVSGPWKELPKQYAGADEFVANILAATGSQFTDNWYLAGSHFRGIERVIAKLFLLSPLNLSTLRTWHMQGLPLPFCAIAIRDSIWVNAHNIIVSASGLKNLGAFKVVDWRMTIGKDASNQTEIGTLAAWSGAQILKNRNVITLQGVKIDSIIRGHGTSTLTPEMRLENLYTKKESICFHLMPVGSELPSSFTLAGTADRDPTLVPYQCAQEPTIPCAARLYDTLKVEELLRLAMMAGESKDDNNEINTVIHSGTYTTTQDGKNYNVRIPGSSPLGMLNGPYDPTTTRRPMLY